MAHAFDNHNASLSEGEPSLLWSGLHLGSLIGHGLARIPRVGCDERSGAAPGVFPPHPARRNGGKKVEGGDPPLFGAGAPPASVHRRAQWRTVNTPLGSLPPQ